MSVIDVDHTQWPLVLYAITGKQTDDDITKLIESYEWCYKKQEKFATITHMTDFSAEVRHIKRLGKWMVANRELMNAYCMGSSLIVPGKSFAFILSSLSLITSFSSPFEVFSSYAPAETWTLDKLRQAR